MTKAKSIFSRDPNGEFIYNGLNAHTSKKYKADTPLDKSFVPYLIMLFCAVVDATVFINLFKLISYDSPIMLGVEVAGFLFAFDAVPLYLRHSTAQTQARYQQGQVHRMDCHRRLRAGVYPERFP